MNVNEKLAELQNTFNQLVAYYEELSLLKNEQYKNLLDKFDEIEKELKNVERDRESTSIEPSKGSESGQ